MEWVGIHVSEARDLSGPLERYNDSNGKLVMRRTGNVAIACTIMAGGKRVGAVEGEMGLGIRYGLSPHSTDLAKINSAEKFLMAYFYSLKLDICNLAEWLVGMVDFSVEFTNLLKRS